MHDYTRIPISERFYHHKSKSSEQLNVQSEEMEHLFFTGSNFLVPSWLCFFFLLGFFFFLCSVTLKIISVFTVNNSLRAQYIEPYISQTKGKIMPNQSSGLL